MKQLPVHDHFHKVKSIFCPIRRTLSASLFIMSVLAIFVAAAFSFSGKPKPLKAEASSVASSRMVLKISPDENKDNLVKYVNSIGGKVLKEGKDSSILLVQANKKTAPFLLSMSRYAEFIEPVKKINPENKKPRISQRVKERVDSHSKANVIVTFHDPVSVNSRKDFREITIEHFRDEILKEMSPDKFTLKNKFKYTPAIAGLVNKQGLEFLENNPLVESVRLVNQTGIISAESIPLIKADVAHSPPYELTGKGVTVAVVDTGIDTDHVDFTGDSSIIDQKCFTSDIYDNQGVVISASDCEGSNPYEGDIAEDRNGHGTNVSGIITAPNGFAPDSKIVPIRVANNEGIGSDVDWNNAFNWIIENNDSLGVDIVNISMEMRNPDGTGLFYDDHLTCDSWFLDLHNTINQLNALGIVVFAGTGNSGSRNGISSPACLSNVIAVGATYDSNLGREPDEGTYYDPYPGSGHVDARWAECYDEPSFDVANNRPYVTCFTNTSTNLYNKIIMAPGARITTTGLGGSTSEYSGTSQATPVAASVAALMLQMDSNLTTNEVRAALETTGTPVYNDQNEQFALINAQSAIETRIPQQCQNAVNITEVECVALKRLYDNTQGPSWNVNTNWLQNNDPCSWHGVECAGSHITKILLNSNGLAGSIPPELGNLTSLIQLRLANNSLSGSIPAGLTNLVNLQYLYLDNNQLSGNIPSSSGNFSSMWYFDLSQNQLSGDIPPTLGNLSNLIALDLKNNQLSGAIPGQLGNLSDLVYLDLNNNKLSGSIPSELSNITYLAELLVNNNSLDGEIPSSICNLTITTVDFGFNMFTSSDPCIDSLDSDWQQSQTIAPSNLQATGSTDDSVSLSWSTIPYTGDGGYYEIVYNISGGSVTQAETTVDKFTNSITVGGLLSNVTYNFSIRAFTPVHDDQQNNLLSILSSEVSAGTTGTSICENVTQIPQVECRALERLYRETNGDNWSNSQSNENKWLMDNLPCNWYGVSCSATNVAEINLESNNLDGSIPPEIANLTYLQVLSLYNNQLSGEIPLALSYLSNLQGLSLSYNQLTGTLPSELGNLSNLEYIILSYNQITGSIPEEIGSLNNLKSLNLSSNKLSGHIPSVLGNLSELQYLDLQNNQLSGEVPQELCTIQGFSEVDLGNNLLIDSDHCINTIDPDWQKTQTVPPTDVQSITKNLSSIEIIFAPIEYQDDGGYYQVDYSITSGGPYSYLGCVTNDKTESSCTVYGLSQDIIYYFVVKTYTPAHGYQKNNLWSISSPQIPATISNNPFIMVTEPDGNNDIADRGYIIKWIDGDYDDDASISLYYNGEIGTNIIVGSISEDDSTDEYMWNTINMPEGEYYIYAEIDDGVNTPVTDYSQGTVTITHTASEYCDGMTVPPALECEALVNLYYSTNGDDWLNSRNNEDKWLVDNDPCTWYGVTCSGGHVAELMLSINNLIGTIPSSIADLSNLNYLYLAQNQLYGSIPPELGSISGLHTLDLSDNQIRGSIPPELGNMSNLFILDLAFNHLDGTIPAELGNFGNLRFLHLNYNNLSGNIPPELGTGTLKNYLWEIGLKGNMLTGTIPPQLGNMVSLKKLYLPNNELNGNIPPELGSLTNLEYLYLAENKLTGYIPSELGLLTNLRNIDLSDNVLGGSFPSEWCDLSNLTYFDISYNKFTDDPCETDLGALWEETQTIAPEPFYMDDMTSSSIDFLISPILYQDDGGYYQINYTTDSSVSYNGNTSGGETNIDRYNCVGWDETGPEVVHEITTSIKGDLTATLSNLLPGEDLDVFILSGCDASQCDNYGGITAQYTDAPPGKYYVIVDGYMGASSTYTLDVSLDVPDPDLSCNSPVKLANGVPYNGTTVGGASNFDTYNCSSWDESGPETVHTITTESTSNIIATLSNVPEGEDLDVFILGGCDNNDCNAYGGDTAIYNNAPAGTHHIIVDGYMGDSGSYTLTVDAIPTGLDCRAPIELINGEAYSGTTVGAPSNIDTYSCIGWVESGPEVVHTINTATTGDITATLSDVTPGEDLDVFILNSCNENNCYGYGGTSATYLDAPPGNYHITVDGYEGASGSYTLTVDTPAGTDLSCYNPVQLNFNYNNTGCFTEDKTGTSCTVTNLQQDTMYHFASRTFTPEHDYQQSDLWSEWSSPVSLKISNSPMIIVTSPDGIDDSAYKDFTIKWTDNDIDDNAYISLYYDTDNSGQDGTQIVDFISEDDISDEYVWDTLGVPDGDYYIYAVIDDGTNPLVVDYSDGAVTIDHRITNICAGVEDIPHAECEALGSFYWSTNGDKWFNSTQKWFEDYSPCSWYGVTCVENHVTELNLYANGIIGHLPSDIADLYYLSSFILTSYGGFNQVSGALPPEMGQMVNLREIYFSGNNLSGTIPAELGNMSNLEVLILSDNSLSGNIPAQLGNLSNLQNLDLSDNQLTGNIPSNLGYMTSLQNLRLSDNQLNGSIPADFGYMGNLQYLNLSYNDLDGAIPGELGKLDNLQYLDLGSNHLTGSIVPELGYINQLEGMDLGRNQLGGVIPSTLGYLSNLTTLQLDRNKLEGNIPSDLINLTNLLDVGEGEFLDLGYNKLTAADPALISFLSTKDPDWEQTQTIPPSNIVIDGISLDDKMSIKWAPIPYQANGGGYLISYSQTPGGPYSFLCETNNKSMDTCTSDRLSQDTKYYFAAQTYTMPHEYDPDPYDPNIKLLVQQNELWSEYSEEINGVIAASVESLRTMINDSNARSEPTSIHLYENFYYSIEQVDNTISGDNGLPVIRGDITIIGKSTTIEREVIKENIPNMRIFNIAPGGTLTLKNVKVKHGSIDSEEGGAIRNEGELILDNAEISQNIANKGGAIYNLGSTNISNSTIAYNMAFNSGGGIENTLGSILTISESSIHGNISGSGGGAINNFGSLTINDAQINENLAASGGGIANGGSASLSASELKNNTTIDPNLTNIPVSGTCNHDDPFKGGGICNYGTLSVTGSIIQSNASIEKGGGIYNDINAGNTSINNSCIVSNAAITNDAITNDNVASLDATGNWWGYTTVPTPSGIIGGNVDYSGFLTSSILGCTSGMLHDTDATVKTMQALPYEDNEYIDDTLSPLGQFTPSCGTNITKGIYYQITDGDEIVGNVIGRSRIGGIIGRSRIGGIIGRTRIGGIIGRARIGGIIGKDKYKFNVTGENFDPVIATFVEDSQGSIQEADCKIGANNLNQMDISLNPGVSHYLVIGFQGTDNGTLEFKSQSLNNPLPVEVTDYSLSGTGLQDEYYLDIELLNVRDYELSNLDFRLYIDSEDTSNKASVTDANAAISSVLQGGTVSINNQLRILFTENYNVGDTVRLYLEISEDVTTGSYTRTVFSTLPLIVPKKLKFEFWDFDDQQEINNLPAFPPTGDTRYMGDELAGLEEYAVRWMEDINFPFSEYYSLTHGKGGELSEQFYDGMVGELSGHLKVENSGLHEFYMTVQDGAKLIIDGTTVIDDTGKRKIENGRVAGNISLAQGHHDIKVQYFEDMGGNGLLLEYRDPVMSTIEVIPSRLFLYNIPPAIQITEPDGRADLAENNFTIEWTDSDPDDDATISLYYDEDNSGQDGTLITSGISENSSTDFYIWDTSTIAEGWYYIYSVINDGTNLPEIEYSYYPVLVSRQGFCATSLCNGDFEATVDLEGWVTGNGLNQITTEVVQDGTKAYYTEHPYDSGQNPRWSGVSQIIMVESAQTYGLTGFYQSENAAQGHIKIIWKDMSGGVLQVDYPVINMSGTNTNWIEFSKLVIAPAGAFTAEIKIWHGINVSLQNVLGSKLWIDSLAFEIATTACGTLCNESFEHGILYWIQSGAVGSHTIERTGAHEGLKTLKSEQLYTSGDPVKWSGVTQYAQVKEGTTYRLRLWLKTLDAANGHVRIKWRDDSGTLINTEYPVVGIAGTNLTWYNREATITAPANAVKAEIAIWHGVVTGNMVGSTLWIDNITLICLELCNGGFEDGNIHWETNGINEGEVITSDVQEGSQAIKIVQRLDGTYNTQWAGISQRIPVTGDTLYDLGFWLKSENAVFGYSKVKWRDANDQLISQQFPIAGINGTDLTWKNLTAMISAPVNAETAEIFIWHGVDGGNNATGSTLYIDDVKFLAVPVNNNPNDILLSNDNINENLPIGSTVGIFTTEDPDSGDQHTYDLVAGTGDSGNSHFTVNNITGELTSNTVFDYETNNSYSIRIRTTDDGTNPANLTYEEVFTINVLDVNDPPSIQLSEPDGIADTADASYNITWTDYDHDSNANISLYYDTDNSGQDGTLIVTGINEDDPADTYAWNTSSIQEGSYYIYGVIDDGINPQLVDYSSGRVTILHSLADDNYEENDILLTAYDLSLFEQTWLSAINGLGVQADDDWYKIQVDSGYEKVLIDCQFSHSQGDIDIAFYDSLGNYLVASRSFTDNEYLDYVVPSEGIYYIRVYYDNEGNTYDLLWDGILEDKYEKNDTLETAYDLSLNEQTWLSAIDGLGVQWDDDWYKIQVDSGYERVLINCLFSHSLGNIDISLYNSSGTSLSSSQTATDDETIDYLVSAAGTYYIRVYSGNAGNTYDLWWNDIREDNYEENDTWQTAYNISAYEQTWLSTINGVGAQGDDDWYRIQVDSGYERVLIDCRFTHSQGDIDIALYNSSGSYLAASTTSTDNEYIDYIVPASGTYYIRVYNSNIGNTYDLWWNDKREDKYEQNDTWQTAYNISAYENTWLSSINGAGVQGDDDWFRIQVDSGYERVLIDCQFTHSLGDINIALYNSSGSYLVASTSSTDDEYIDYIVSASGTYYIKVYYSNAGNTYDLWWNDKREDKYEENDTLQTAYNISAYEQTWLSSINGVGVQSDEDWYRIQVDSGYERVLIDCRFTHSQGDIDITLYNSSGSYLTASTTTTDDEYIDYIVPASGTYYVRVYYSNIGNTYDLWWNDKREDKYEENDTWQTAYNISAYENTWLSSINGVGVQSDDDWYRVQVDSGYERVLIDCQFTHSLGNINIALYNSSGGYLSASTTSTDDEYIDYIVPASGTYYIRVYYSNIGNTYDLWWNDKREDKYEENDTLQTAYNLSAYENTWLSSINGLGVQGDDDWYRILVDSGYERVLIDCQFTDSLGDIDIALYNSSGSALVASTTTTDDEYIDYIVPASGTYYIKVYYSNIGNTYNLWWNDMREDKYEENDTWQTAYNLSSYENTWLSSINGLGVQSDDDWYRIQVDSGYERVLIDCQFTDSLGDIDIALYNSSGSYLAASTSTTDDEYIDYIVSASGTYYIRVYYSNSGNTYNLWWNDKREDKYEKNDTWQTAYNLSSYELTWLSSINGLGVQNEDDWYSILVDSGYERVLIDCQFSDSLGDIDIALYNSSGGYLAASTSTTDDEYIDYVVPASGTYYIRVYYSNIGNTYNLWWDDVREDKYEENDTWQTAYNLSSYENTWLSSINGYGVQSDEDWYRIYVDVGNNTIRADCRFTDSLGDIDIALYNSSGGYLTASASTTDNEYIQYKVPSTGTYYIKVYYGNAGNTYNLWWDDIYVIQ